MAHGILWWLQVADSYRSADSAKKTFSKSELKIELIPRHRSDIWFFNDLRLEAVEHEYARIEFQLSDQPSLVITRTVINHWPSKGVSALFIRHSNYAIFNSACFQHVNAQIRLLIVRSFNIKMFSFVNRKQNLLRNQIISRDDIP